MNITRCTHVLTIWVTALLLSACLGLGDKAPEPRAFKGSLRAAEIINPGTDGRPKPVVVRVYQLRNDTAFSNGSFSDIYFRADSYLSADLVSSEEFQIRPGQTVDFSDQFDPETRFIGAVAAFRDIDSATWATSWALPIKKQEIRWKKKHRLRVDVEGLSVNLVHVTKKENRE